MAPPASTPKSKQQRALTSLIGSLQAENGIAIYIADVPPVYVQRVLLERTSDFFVKALRNSHLGANSQANVLKFPDDDKDAWKILLHWLYHHKLPIAILDDDNVLTVRCWILGDKYNIPDFQNQVMYRLLRQLFDLDGTRDPYVSVAVLEEAVPNSPPDCVLRKLMAEETAIALSEKRLKSKDLELLDGSGFLTEVLGKQVDYKENGFDRGFMDGEVADFADLNEYMVGEGFWPV